MTEPNHGADDEDTSLHHPDGHHMQLDTADHAAQHRDNAAEQRDAHARAIEARSGHIDPAGERARLFAQHDRAAAAADRARAADRTHATVDTTTGVLRRDSAMAALDRLRGGCTPPSSIVVAFIDIDDFKAVNDTRGHRAGDIVLRSVADSVVAALRHDDVVIRYGGDEFLVGTTGVSVVDLTSRLTRAALELRNRHGLNISFGAACGSANDTLESTIGRADAALYATRRRTRSV